MGIVIRVVPVVMGTVTMLVTVVRMVPVVMETVTILVAVVEKEAAEAKLVTGGDGDQPWEWDQ